MLNLTEQQVIDLAPDAASVKAGKSLVKVPKWPLLEFSENAVYGHCQGSGKNPYKTVVDAKNMAFKCSCPSRKFPCKHALALLLLYVNHQDSFTQVESGKEADFVREWLDKREANAAKKEEKAKAIASDPKAKEKAEKAKAKREEKRHQNVAEGLEELKTRLEDLIRGGLIQNSDTHSLLRTLSKRLVDCQAPRLSNNMLELMAIDTSTDEGKIELLKGLSLNYLVANLYDRLDTLDEDWKNEVLSQIGFTQAKEEILATEPLQDEFIILYKERSDIGNVTSYLYALYGINSKRLCYTMDFMVDPLYVTGRVYKGKIHFYKGVGDYRRVLFVKDDLATNEPDATSEQTSNNEQMQLADLKSIGYDTFKECLEGIAQLQQQNPFVHNIPGILTEARLAFKGNEAYITDKLGYALKLHPNSVSNVVEIAALTMSNPFAVVFYFENDCLVIRAIQYSDIYKNY